jgi:hypothetical protein
LNQRKPLIEARNRTDVLIVDHVCLFIDRLLHFGYFTLFRIELFTQGRQLDFDQALLCSVLRFELGLRERNVSGKLQFQAASKLQSHLDAVNAHTVGGSFDCSDYHQYP